MRSRFDDQLDVLNTAMITMGSLCEQAIATAAKALAEGNAHLAKEVADLSEQIDQKELEEVRKRYKEWTEGDKS